MESKDSSEVFEDFLPDDGVYYRAPGVSHRLRSFPHSGPVNIYKDQFKVENKYTNEVPSRIQVPAEKKRWEVSYPEYSPPEYITENVWSNSRNLNPKGWGDPDPNIREDDPRYMPLFKKFNPIWVRGIQRDREGNILHPYGRTGIRGQGVLGNRRINEAVDPIVLHFDGKEVKILLVKRNPRDTLDNSWAIPGGMVDYRPESDSYTVPVRLNNLLSSAQVKAPTALRRSIIHKDKNTTKVQFVESIIPDTKDEGKDDNGSKDNIGDAYRELKEETGFEGRIAYHMLLAHMYSDDVRNTDTTWIVTSLFLLIAEKAEMVTGDGVETAEARWVSIMEALEFDFFASHRIMILAAIRYYIVRSFHDRGISNTRTHELAFKYLRQFSELDLPLEFSELLMLKE